MVNRLPGASPESAGMRSNNRRVGPEKAKAPQSANSGGLGNPWRPFGHMTVPKVSCSREGVNGERQFSER
jgi:hypothetical protein